MIAQWVREGALQMGIELSQEAPEQFESYFHMLEEANQRMNLTRVLEPREAVDRHFLDSIAPLKLPGLLCPGQTLIDVGTGAGFPGIPLAIACPGLRVTLLDSLQKRVGFLDEVIRALGLSARAVHGRAEEAARDPLLRDGFDRATARAVAALPVLMELALPFVRPRGQLILYKGPGLDEELAQSANAIGRLGGRVRGVQPVLIPGRDWDHRLLMVDKLCPTPKPYPRKPGEPGRKPL